MFIRIATFDLGPLKAPGPDGFQTDLYHKYWDIVGHEITSCILAFFKGYIGLEEINETIIVLIPKFKNPTNSTHF